MDIAQFLWKAQTPIAVVVQSDWQCSVFVLQVLVVRFVSLFDVKDRTVTFLGGKKYSVDTLRAMGASDLLNSMFDFSEKLINLGLSEEEMSLFTAVVLVSAGWFLSSI